MSQTPISADSPDEPIEEVTYDPNSILDSLKKVLNVPADYDGFDLDIIMHTNGVFSTLHQLGVGKSGFTISDRTALWSEFYPPSSNFDQIRTYIYMKVRLAFDPPQTANAVNALQEACKEFEWRLNVRAETEVLDDV